MSLLLQTESARYNHPMNHPEREPLTILRELASPDDLRSDVDADPEASLSSAFDRPRFNAHIHLPPNFSAFESVTQAIQLAESQQIRVLGVSNYYDYSVYGPFARLAMSAGIFPVFGLETICLDPQLRDAGIKVNDPGNPGKIYLCGKGITRFCNHGADQLTPKATELLGKIRRQDATRMADMVQRLEQTFRQRGFDTGLSEADVIQMVERRHQSPRDTVFLQERHICQAFQEKFFQLVPPADRKNQLKKLLGADTKADGSEDYVTIQNEIRSHLMKSGKPAFVEETFVDFQEAMQLILQMGGIPCYPTLADGTSPICPFEQPPLQLVSELKRRNVYAAELIPVRNTIQVASQYIRTFRKAGMIVTCGTEHNTLDCLPLTPYCRDGEIPEDILAILWEGTCVVAAHQSLTLHGKIGFVDAHGNPNPAYASDEDRIMDFARLGAAVISRYVNCFA